MSYLAIVLVLHYVAFGVIFAFLTWAIVEGSRPLFDKNSDYAFRGRHLVASILWPLALAYLVVVHGSIAIFTIVRRGW